MDEILIAGPAGYTHDTFGTTETVLERRVPFALSTVTLVVTTISTLIVAQPILSFPCQSPFISRQL